MPTKVPRVEGDGVTEDQITKMTDLVPFGPVEPRPYTYDRLKKLWADEGESHPARGDLTCSRCRLTDTCVFSWYSFNTNDECLAMPNAYTLIHGQCHSDREPPLEPK